MKNDNQYATLKEVHARLNERTPATDPKVQRAVLAAYTRAYHAAQAGGMNETDSDELGKEALERLELAYVRRSNGNMTQFAVESEHDGIDMVLVGQWQDLSAYYHGSDGNAWCYSQGTYRWSNCGEFNEFVKTFQKHHRGQLFSVFDN